MIPVFPLDEQSGAPAAAYLDSITKSYPDFNLGPINLEIPAGYVTGIMGANGAGKTTTIKILLGMVHPTRGTVGHPAKEHMGVVLDVPPYDPQWRPTTIAKVLGPFYPTWSDRIFTDLLNRFGVPIDRPFKELSRGQAMKLQVAAAFAHDADLLILDEPTSGLDPLSRSELADIIAQFMLDPRRSVLLSSHITSDIEKVADYVAIFHDGQIVASAEKSELIDAFRLIRGLNDTPTADLAHIAHGLRRHSVGWDALVPTSIADALPATDIVTDIPTLDDILVRIAKGHE